MTIWWSAGGGGGSGDPVRGRRGGSGASTGAPRGYPEIVTTVPLAEEGAPADLAMQVEHLAIAVSVLMTRLGVARVEIGGGEIAAARDPLKVRYARDDADAVHSLTITRVHD